MSSLVSICVLINDSRHRCNHCCVSMTCNFYGTCTDFALDIMETCLVGALHTMEFRVLGQKFGYAACNVTFLIFDSLQMSLLFVIYAHMTKQVYWKFTIQQSH